MCISRLLHIFYIDRDIDITCIAERERIDFTFIDEYMADWALPIRM